MITRIFRSGRCWRRMETQPELQRGRCRRAGLTTSGSEPCHCSPMPDANASGAMRRPRRPWSAMRRGCCRPPARTSDHTGSWTVSRRAKSAGTISCPAVGLITWLPDSRVLVVAANTPSPQWLDHGRRGRAFAPKALASANGRAMTKGFRTGRGDGLLRRHAHAGDSGCRFHSAPASARSENPGDQCRRSDEACSLRASTRTD